MSNAHDRLRQLRIRAGYERPVDAARAFGFNEHTYKSHENGNRGIGVAAAQRYARVLNSTATWILTGRGEEQPTLTDDELILIQKYRAVAPEIRNMVQASLAAAPVLSDPDTAAKIVKMQRKRA